MPSTRGQNRQLRDMWFMLESKPKTNNIQNSLRKDETMTFEQAQQIIENIVEAAYLNARDIDQDEAQQIDQASEIYFEKVNNLLNKEIENNV